jgi:hypothetical protein
MNTYFFVEVVVGGKTIIVGPYLSQLQAAEIMMEHMEVVLGSKNLVTNQFKARVTEKLFLDGHWELLAIRGEEERSLI